MSISKMGGPGQKNAKFAIASFLGEGAKEDFKSFSILMSPTGLASSVGSKLNPIENAAKMLRVHMQILLDWI